MCILLNCVGTWFAYGTGIPIKLDSTGTILAASLYGPILGGAVGMFSVIIFGFLTPVSYAYVLSGISVGVAAGILARKGMFSHLLGVMSVGAVVTVVSVLVNTPLNWMILGGSTGNQWGDGIIALLQKWGWNDGVCYLTGELYVDFPDRVITVFLVFVLIKLYRIIRIKRKIKYKKNVHICSLFLISVICGSMWIPWFSSYAAEEKKDYNMYMQTVYNEEDGLPGGMVSDVEQTQDGVLWVGTYGGLYRYSGNQFECMEEYETVKTVNCLFADSEGRLWVGTNGEGLSVCENNTVTYVMSEEDGLPADSVRCIEEGTDGKYYVGTSDSLVIVAIEDGLQILDVIPEIRYAESIAADSTGLAAAVTNEGELFLLNDSEIIEKVECNVEGQSYSCCLFGKSDRLFVGTTANELQIFRAGTEGLRKERTMFCSNLSNIEALTFSENGELFICADNGVGHINYPGQFRTINTNDFCSSLERLIFDYQGNIWLASSRQGLMKMCESVFTELYKKNGMQPRVVNAVTEWNGKLYVGTDSGLDVMNENLSGEENSVLAQKLEGVRIRSLMTDSQNRLWICTSGLGAWVVDSAGSVAVYDTDDGVLGDMLRMALELKNGTVVLAGDAGITYIENGKVSRTVGPEEGLRNPRVLCMLEAEDGSILAGTDGNGISVIKDGEVVDDIQREDGLPSEVVLRLTADSDGYGTYIVTGNGLFFMDQERNVRLLSNFPYYNNFDVAESDDGKLFVLSSAGIYVVDKESLLSGEELEYVLLDSKKGLRGGITPNAWSYIGKDENLFFCCDSGVTVLNLKEYDVSNRSYRMGIRSVQVDEQKYTADEIKRFVIPSSAKRIKITPEIINYSTDIPYVRIYLEGFDTEPQIVLQNELSDIVYTNLEAGTYTFHLAVMDNSGQPIAESSFPIIKEREFYDNWWFSVYAASLFIFAILYIVCLVFLMQMQRTARMQKHRLDMANETILTIARTVDAKDQNTSEHSVRVSEYSVQIAQKLGLGKEDCEGLRKTALLHDIGKIGIPDSILCKPGRLTDEEFTVMKSHVVKGAEILRNFTGVKNIVDGVLYHHERYDGKGYVHGLRGEEIPLNARIIGVADAFDAMTANRVYRKKMDVSYAVEELKRGRGTQFDPQVVDAFLELIKSGKVQVDREEIRGKMFSTHS